jgi:hypothetical protein
MSNINLDKTSWELVEIVKETTKKNLVAAIKNNQLKVDQDVLPRLFAILDSSVSEGYNKSYKNFSTKFLKISKQFSDDQSQETVLKKRK